MIKLEDVQRGYDAWAAKHHNAKWVRRIDGTPIQNDIVVSIFDALKAIAPQASVSAAPVVKPLEWSETRDPTEEIRYTHVIAETPFGIYSIEWKAWRDNDPPCVYLNGDYVECCHNLDAAKNAAKTQLEQRILSALASPPPSPVDADAIIERCAQAVKSAPLGEELRAIRALQGQVTHD